MPLSWAWAFIELCLGLTEDFRQSEWSFIYLGVAQGFWMEYPRSPVEEYIVKQQKILKILFITCQGLKRATQEIPITLLYIIDSTSAQVLHVSMVS